MSAEIPATVLDRIGGGKALDAAVEEFYFRLLCDEDLLTYFHGVDLQALKRHQQRFLTLAFTNQVPSHVCTMVAEAHSRLFAKGLSEVHFDLVAGHLVGTLYALGIGESLVNEIVAIVAPLRTVFQQNSIKNKVQQLNSVKVEKEAAVRAVESRRDESRSKRRRNKNKTPDLDSVKVEKEAAVRTVKSRRDESRSKRRRNKNKTRDLESVKVEKEAAASAVESRRKESRWKRRRNKSKAQELESVEVEKEAAVSAVESRREESRSKHRRNKTQGVKVVKEVSSAVHVDHPADHESTNTETLTAVSAAESGEEESPLKCRRNQNKVGEVESVEVEKLTSSPLEHRPDHESSTKESNTAVSAAAPCEDRRSKRSNSFWRRLYFV